VDIDVLTNTEYFQYQTTTLTGGAPTVETLLQQRIITLNLDAVFSLVDSGLPIALALRESLVNAHSGGLGDVNDRIFRLWLGPNDTEPQGDKSTAENAPFGGDVRFFASGNAGFLSQNGSAATAGLRDTREAGTVGAELKVSPKFRIGLAATYVHSDTDFSGGLGSQHIDGAALSLYATVREERWFADLLYSVGLFSDTTDRNTLLGSNARGTSGDVSHLVSLNTGWLFKVGDTFATGPYASLTYVHGDLAGTTESGGGTANLVRSAQSYDSLVSTVGWQANWKLRRSWGALKPLVHIGWERENLSDAGAAGVTLLQSPFSFSGGSSFGSFGMNTRRESARYDAMVAGVILGVDLGERWSVSLRATERTDFGPRNDFSIAASAGLRF
ncbi:MAG: autotransporter outer membrane beta-barrel domain-containing protein, partial [Chthoniobacteraceae bacterium]